VKVVAYLRGPQSQWIFDNERGSVGADGVRPTYRAAPASFIVSRHRIGVDSVVCVETSSYSGLASMTVTPSRGPRDDRVQFHSYHLGLLLRMLGVEEAIERRVRGSDPAGASTELELGVS
jgi:hypothetical protein